MQHLDKTNKHRNKRSQGKAVLIALALIIIAGSVIAVLLLARNKDKGRPGEPVETIEPVQILTSVMQVLSELSRILLTKNENLRY